MNLEVGEIITLDSNNKDYIVINKTNYNNNDYYYLMTAKKPIEVIIVKLELNQNNTPVIVTVTDKSEINNIMKLTAKSIN